MLFQPLIAISAYVFYVHAMTQQLSPRGPAGTKNVVVQMFEWSWNSVATECTSFLGPAGYGFVQVSPPSEHISGSPWWTDYQPVSYTLTSKRGDRNDFANMIQACHNADVGVIADTVLNHMSSADSGTGVAGSAFTHYNYPGTYQVQDFHHCGLEPNDNIVNYNNRLEVQTCQLVGLADLATNTSYVRERLAQYVNDLLSLGVDGLRIDAAKHISATDLSDIMSRLDRNVYITQEVIFGAGEPIQPSEYIGIGDVQEFRFTSMVKDAFLGTTSLSTLANFDNKGLVPGNKANVFVANHDTERNGNSLNLKSPSNAYVLATLFSLAQDYGTLTLLSSYGFQTVDDGAPNGGAGTCSTNGGANGWLCQHRFPAFAGMVSFRNAVSGPIINLATATNQQLTFGRGSSGHIVINNEDFPWDAKISTSLPPGIYCDVVAGPASTGVCPGASYAVSSSGVFSATVSPRNAVAIHIGAKSSSSAPTNNPSPPLLVRVDFEELANTPESVFLVGSIPQLGDWDPSKAVPMSSAAFPTWKVSISLSQGTTFQYKYIKKTSTGAVIWESDPNRSDTVPSAASQTLNDVWR